MTTLTQISKSDILDFTRELRQKNPDLCFLADAIVEAIENKAESDRIIASQDQMITENEEMIADLRKKNKKRKKKIKKMEAVTSDLIVKINDMQETLDDLASQMQE